MSELQPIDFSDVMVLGGGPWAVVLAGLLALNHREVCLYVKDPKLCAHLIKKRSHPDVPEISLPDGVYPISTLENASKASMLFFAAPVRSFKSMVDEAGPHIRGNQVLVSASRGLEPGTGRTMSQILRDETCARKIGALAGPRLISEMAQGAPGAAVIGSPYREVRDAVEKALTSPVFRAYGSNDRLGVEYGGALASCLTFLGGVVAGLGFGAGVQSIVMTRGIREVSNLGESFGADPETFSGMACLGIVVAASLSRTRKEWALGQEIGEYWAKGQHGKAPKGGEEIGAIAQVALNMAKKQKVGMPLLESTRMILQEGADPSLLKRSLMRIPTGSEKG